MAGRELEIQPGWWIALRFWWAFMWRMMLFSSVVGAGFTWLLNRVGDADSWQNDAIIFVSGIVFLVFEIWLMRRLLAQRFGGFRIAVLKTVAED